MPNVRIVILSGDVPEKRARELWNFEHDVFAIELEREIAAVAEEIKAEFLQHPKVQAANAELQDLFSRDPKRYAERAKALADTVLTPIWQAIIKRYYAEEIPGIVQAEYDEAMKRYRLDLTREMRKDVIRQLFQDGPTA